MPLRTSDAFVIDVRRMQEADRLVTLLTEDEGKIRGVAPSAAKSLRRFGGKLERLSRVRVTYFEKEGRDLSRIDSCDLLEESFTLHQDLRVAVMLSYVAEVVDTFARERESDRRFFRLLGAVMSATRAGVDARLLARYFEIWTLRLHGLMPDLESCGGCGRSLTGPAGATIEVGDMPVALCPGCRKTAGHGRGRLVSLSPAALAALDRFRTLAPGDLKNLAFPPAAMAQIESFASALLTAFVGHPFRSYRFMKDLGLAQGDGT